MNHAISFLNTFTWPPVSLCRIVSLLHSFWAKVFRERKCIVFVLKDFFRELRKEELAAEFADGSIDGDDGAEQQQLRSVV